MPQQPRLRDLNQTSRQDFTAMLGDIFEHSPWVAEIAWQARPINSIGGLHAAMFNAVQTTSETQKLALLRAHPQLAGKKAQKGELTKHSTAEQKGAGLADLSSTEARRMAELNRAYSERFGFPFIIAVKGMSKSDILAQLEQRAQNPRADELKTAIAQVGIIARHRLATLLGDN